MKRRLPSTSARSVRPGSLPFVFVNMAMSADGKIATANRRVSTFSSARDQEHLYELRATADAVMAGARTVDLNRIKLGAGGRRFREERLRQGLTEQALRVIVSGSGTIDPRAALFRHRFSPILILGTERIPRVRLRWLQEVADEVLICGVEAIDFAYAFSELRRRWKVRRLLCEGGGEVNSPLFRAGLVDELHLTLCPKIIGGRSAPTIVDGEGVVKLSEAKNLRLFSWNRVGDELFLVFRRAGRQPRRRSSTIS